MPQPHGLGEPYWMRVFLHKPRKYLIVPQRWEKSSTASMREVVFAWSPVQLGMLIRQFIAVAAAAA